MGQVSLEITIFNICKIDSKLIKIKLKNPSFLTQFPILLEDILRKSNNKFRKRKWVSLGYDELKKI